MSKHDDILRSEKIINELLSELEGLKSTRRTMDDASECTHAAKLVTEALIAEVRKFVGHVEEILATLAKLNLDVSIRDFSSSFQRSGVELKEAVGKLREAVQAEIAKASEAELEANQQLSSEIDKQFSKQTITIGVVREQIAEALKEHYTAIEAKMQREAIITRRWLIGGVVVIMVAGAVLIRSIL